MSGESSSGPDRSRLEQISDRLAWIAERLGDPGTSDSEATGLADEAAGLVSEALEETERAVAGLEPGD